MAVMLKYIIFVIGIMWLNYPQTAEALPVSLFQNVVHNFNSSVMENKKEIWESIPGYVGKYEVSNYGNVKSLKRKNRLHEKILKPSIDAYGYYVVGLLNNGKIKTRTIHQLVAESFLKHIPNGNKIVVNHKNLNKLDNRLANLELITNRENTNKKHVKSSSKYTGVHYDKKNKRWISQILFNKKREYLGRYNNEYDAHLAYQSRLKEILS